MRRREFLLGLGGAAAAWPLPARAQQVDRLPTIGVLGSTSAAWSRWLGGFLSRLRELGWIENRTINIEYRWTEGRPERYAEFGAEFADAKSMSSCRSERPPSSRQKRRHPSSP